MSGLDHVLDSDSHPSSDENDSLGVREYQGSVLLL